ncbi:MAG TPA: winged helix-turn-helix domain-containing protein, partial [Vicinamibacterales bacterium]
MPGSTMQIHITLKDGTTLRAALYEQLRQAILDGRIRSGEALPASRDLARQLAVSRSTVEVVYERLAGEGFVQARRGAGTFVSDALIPPSNARGRNGGAAALTARSVWKQVPLSRAYADRVRYDFRTGL